MYVVYLVAGMVLSALGFLGVELGGPGEVLFVFLLFFYLLIIFLYFGYLPYTNLQGTLGKRMLGIKIVNEFGERISFGQAVGRFLMYSFISPIFYIGFIMIAFTERKQGLHDLVAKTYCVER